jgi:serine/threonine protein kinase
MEFPTVESTLFKGLIRVRKAEIDPQIELDEVEGSTESPPEKSSTRSASDPRPRYVFKGELGRGGMGAVYKVYDTDLHRTLAMKVAFSAENSGTHSPADNDPTMLERFLEEAQVTGQLDHPGIVPLHEVGMDSAGRVYFTMRMVKGKHLGEIFELARKNEEGWTRERVLIAIARMCEAMAYAHAKGVVHRDLKPANVMAGRFGEVYVMDWGLAKVRGRAKSGEIRAPEITSSQTYVHTRRTSNASADHLKTSHGTVFGTPVYMSPEQARGEMEKVDARSDIYSVGAILYQFLTGRPPYARPGAQLSAQIVLKWVLDGPPDPVRKLAPAVSPELAAICEKAMAREPVDRYQEMQELVEDLRCALIGRPVSAMPIGPTLRIVRWCRRNRLAAGLLVAVTAGAAYGIWRLNDMSNDVVRQAALDSTATEAQILRDVNAFYNSAVASRVDRTHVQVTHDYAKVAGAIPIPATFLTDLGEKISAHAGGVKVRQYSDYPFKFRPPWQLDDFEKDALAQLRAAPDKPVHRFETVDGQPYLRYAVGRKMEAGCVTCHNAHPDSPKTDWKEGDMRGVLEITRPLDQDVARMKAGFRGTMLYIAGIVGGMLALVSFFVIRHSMKSRESSKV